MLKSIFLGLVIWGSASCGSKYEEYATYYPIPEERAVELINPNPDVLDFQDSRTIYNEYYPIYLRLLPEGKFHFEIPEYDSGFGQWVMHKDGIQLEAEAKYGYTMVFNLRAVDEEGKQLKLIFQDRYKLRNLKLSYQNIR